MAIAFVQKQEATGTTAAVNIPPFGSLPGYASLTMGAPPTVGNVLIAVIGWNQASGIVQTFPAGVGWTLVQQTTSDVPATDTAGAIAYKKVTSATTTLNPFSTGDNGDSYALAVYEYSGVDGNAPLNVADGIQYDGNPFITPTITPSASVERLLIGLAFRKKNSAGAWSGETFNGSTSGVTERSDITRATITIAAWELIVSLTSGSYYGTVVPTSTGEGGGALIAAFKPSPPAAVGTQEIAVEIAFSTEPGSVTPSWTDVTAYVRSCSIRRGRQHELDQMQAGTCTLMLLNTDGRFDPTNTAGPYYPNVLPMRRIRVTGNYNSVGYPLFSGFVESWPMSWEGNLFGTVSVTASDGFKVLGLKMLNNSYPSERSDLRVGRVLDDAGWSTAARSLSQGISALSSGTLANANALAHLQTVMLTENGRFFISASGGAWFQSRHDPYNSTVSNATFGDTSSELSYTGIVINYDDTQIWNEVRVAGNSGIDQVQTDTATSQLHYFARTLTRTGLLIDDDNEASAAAGFLLAQYKDPVLRIESIEMEPATDSSGSLYVQGFGREIGDRVTVNRRPPGGSTISQQSFIEGAEFDFAIGTLSKIRWRLSAVGAGYSLGNIIYLDQPSGKVETAQSGVLVY